MQLITLGVTREDRPGERRVALTPDVAKRYVALGLRVVVESGAGEQAAFTDQSYREAGAELVERGVALQADILLRVQRPAGGDLGQLRGGTVLACFSDIQAPGSGPDSSPSSSMAQLAATGISLLSMEHIPRISRAQAMDALSSQANIAGYRAVLEAATQYQRFFPLLMTSAGTAKPARVVVLGVGVAGLQAIATARRLGARVEAFDVRAETREQVLSLGAKFIDIDLGEEGSGAGGYARELSAQAKERQQAALADRLQQADVIITTAQIPGKPAPVLVREEVVQGMRSGSVIVDLAAASGGNCPLSEPDRVVVRHGVTLVGYTNFPALLATDASAFYASNLFHLLGLLLARGEDGGVTLRFDLEDPIINGCLLIHAGVVRSI